jgi:hypothetical protein
LKAGANVYTAGSEFTPPYPIDIQTEIDNGSSVVKVHKAVQLIETEEPKKTVKKRAKK